MQFHPDKCSVMHITTKKNPIHHKYVLHQHTLQTESSTKYLGVTIQSDLKWNKHIDNISSTASKHLNFIKRNLKVNSKSVKEKAYTSLIRPKLEYSSCVWDPHTKSNISKLEMIQCRAARYTCNRFHNTNSVMNMLTELKCLMATNTTEKNKNMPHILLQNYTSSSCYISNQPTSTI